LGLRFIFSCKIFRYMPSNETLYQLGRGDLADAVRDTKGWVYYAKRLLLPPRYRCVASSK